MISALPRQEPNETPVATHALLEGIIEHAGNAIVVVEAVRDGRDGPGTGNVVDFRYVLANRMAYEQNGVPPGQMIGQTMLTLFPGLNEVLFPGSDETIFARYVRQMHEGGPLTYETPYHQDGFDGVYLVTANRLLDGLIITLVDVTAQRQAQQQAAGQARLFDGLLDTMLTGLNILDVIRDERGELLDLRYRHVSRTVARDTGRPPEQFVGQRMRTLFPGVTQSRFWQGFQDLLRTGEPQQFEVHYNADGYDSYLEASLTLLDADTIISSYTIVSERKWAQQRAEAQARTLRLILDNVPASLFISEAVRDEQRNVVDFRIVEANRLALMAYGLPREAVVGHLASALFPRDRHNGVFDRYCHVVTTGQPDHFELNVAVDGQPRWIDAWLTPMDADRVIASSLDVTAIRQAQRQAAEQAELLRSVVDGSHNPIIAFDSVRNGEGRIVDFRYILQNEANRRNVKRTDEQVIGHTMLEYFPGVVERGLFDRYVNVVETGKPLRLEHFYSADGLDGWFDISVVKRGDGIVLTLQDNTSIRRAEQRLKEQAALMTTILENARANLSLLEPIRSANGRIDDFRYVFTNAANARMTGRSVPEMTGNRLLTLFPGLEATTFFARLMHTAETGEESRFLFPYYADGVAGWFDVSFVPQGDAVLFTSTDVTESHQYRQQLEQANRDLKRSNEHLQQFAYVASHDLQEPLRKIQSFGNLLYEQYSPALGEGGADLLRRMQGAAGRMSDLVRGLLTYSRLASQQQPFRPVALTALVQDVVADLELTIQTQRARLHIAELPTVPGDAPQLRQLFQNLLSNALKYVAPGTPPEVTITCQRIDAERSGSATGPCWEISVQDNGIGFDPKHSERIFQMFQRLHGKSQYEGSGMGLALCKRVVDNHKGTITAHSQPGAGATFVVRLPAGESPV